MLLIEDEQNYFKKLNKKIDILFKQPILELFYGFTASYTHHSPLDYYMYLILIELLFFKRISFNWPFWNRPFGKLIPSLFTNDAPTHVRIALTASV